LWWGEGTLIVSGFEANQRKKKTQRGQRRKRRQSRTKITRILAGTNIKKGYKKTPNIQHAPRRNSLQGRRWVASQQTYSPQWRRGEQLEEEKAKLEYRAISVKRQRTKSRQPKMEERGVCEVLAGTGTSKLGGSPAFRRQGAGTMPGMRHRGGVRRGLRESMMRGSGSRLGEKSIGRFHLSVSG